MTAPPRPNLRLTLPPVLTPTETAALVGVTRKTLQKPEWDARLRPFRTLGGHRRYRRETVARVREEQAQTADQRLALEVKGQADKSARAPGLLVAPPVDEDYWTYRVRLSEKQAIVGFPKFGLTGIGFAQEEDWNTNLPSSCDAGEIYDHIRHNKGDDSISREDCIAAIRMIQDAARGAS